jgi:ankyrin repeat protein
MSQLKDEFLRDAIHARQTDRVRALLADGADLTSTDETGLTPLMVAASAGSPEIVELLLSAGADPKPKDKFGYSAQDLAYWYGEYRMGAYTPESLRIVEMLQRATSHDAA